MNDGFTIAEVVFFLTLVATFAAAALGRIHSKSVVEGGIANQKLNRWLVGLSGGATANSGFVVTGAVGLGYTYGIQWLFLPVAWLIGDIVFWTFFPQRINRVGRISGATTISELLTSNISGRIARITAIIITIIIVSCLGLYISAQWLAGQKFLSGAFGLSGLSALGLFGVLIVAYTTIGGFRGSVYADAFQAVIRLIGTIVALVAVIWFALDNKEVFSQNITAAGTDFMQILPANLIGFTVGFASAALGFGLGQPQLVSRYLAGSSPEETQSAWWVYIGFVQFTWIAMTLFGVILRGVMPGITDGEAGLSIFFQQNIGGVITGIIIADIFATIAATSNSLLVSVAQSITYDLLPKNINAAFRKICFGISILVVGGVTMVGSLYLAGEQSVFQVAIAAVSLMGSALAGPVMIKVLSWKHTGFSLLMSIMMGLLSAMIWKYSGLSVYVNESFTGIVMGLFVNFIIVSNSLKVYRIKQL